MCESARVGEGPDATGHGDGGNGAGAGNGQPLTWYRVLDERDDGPAMVEVVADAELVR